VTVAARYLIDVEALRIESGAPLAQRGLSAEQRTNGEAVRILVGWAATGI
jgi:guanine deaminase